MTIPARAQTMHALCYNDHPQRTHILAKNSRMQGEKKQANIISTSLFIDQHQDILCVKNKNN